VRSWIPSGSRLLVGVFACLFLTISCLRGPRESERRVAHQAEPRTRTSVGVEKPAAVPNNESQQFITRTGTAGEPGCEVSFYHEQLVVDCFFAPCPADAVASLVSLQNVLLEPGEQGWAVIGQRKSPPRSPHVGQLSASGDKWYLDLQATAARATCRIGEKSVAILEESGGKLPLIGIQVRQIYRPNSSSP
jgi:hypothetical protein